MSEERTDIVFWSVGEEERLSHYTEDDAIEDFLSMFALPGGAWADNTPTSLELVGYARMEMSLHPGSTVDRTLELLDDEYGDPDGGYSRPTEAMLEAEKAYHAAIVKEYEPWMCEPVVRKTVDVAKWIEENQHPLDVLGTEPEVKPRPPTSGTILRRKRKKTWH